MKHKGDMGQTIGIVLCATLSLAAVLALVLLLEGDPLLAFLALIISLVCPVVWLALLWGSGGKGLGQQVR